MITVDKGIWWCQTVRLAYVALVASFFPSLYSTANLSADELPNILWLISEDNSKHYLKLFDKHGVETPNIEKLASSGIVFERAFSNAPVCSVARTTLITGCMAPKIATQFHRKTQPATLPTGIEMFPALLRRAGYYTSNNSKKDYNAIEPEGVWDASSKNASWRDRKANQPFFHQQTFGQSHEGGLHFDLEQMKTHPTRCSCDEVFVAPYHPQTELFRYTNAFYRDQIQLIDNAAGKVIDDLKKDGLFDSTFIFYFGDHGGVLPGSKGYLYETGVHIPLVVHIPDKFKALVPHVLPPGTRSQAFVSFIDFGPTALNLAGVEQSPLSDGKPFLGRGINEGDLENRKTAFGYADRFDEKYDLVRSLRKGNFKYIRNFEPANYDGLNNNYRYKQAAYRQWRDLHKAGKLNTVQNRFFEPKPPEMLFDLENDPHETNNLASLDEHQPKLIELRDELTAKQKALPDLSFFPENVLIAQALDNPIQFGKRNKDRIAAMIDVANLQVALYSEIKDKLHGLLQHNDPWIRYWAVNVCIRFGANASELNDDLIKMAADDEEPLVAAAAAQYVGMVKAADPVPLLINLLRNSENRTTLALILNRVVLLSDGHGYRFELKRSWFPKKQKRENVERLLTYLMN